MVKVNNFTVIESDYGRFVVNRHNPFQAEALIKTGRPHIEGELSRILAICATLSKGAVAVDAGANVGLVAVPLALSLRAIGGTVMAFEAQRMMFYALCGAAALNDLENLRAFHQALGAKAGKVRVPPLDYGIEQDFGMLSLVGDKPSSVGEEIEVVAIDGLGLPRLDFLKIDVEGMELDVLEGASATIRSCLPWCWIEYWKVNPERIKSTFSGLSYKFFRMDELNMLCAPAHRVAASNLSISAESI